MRNVTQLDEIGSTLTDEGGKFRVAEFRGPVHHRQELANNLKVLCYVECHLNSVANPNQNYCMAVGAYHHPKKLAEKIVSKMCEAFGHSNSGVAVGMAVKGVGLVSRIRWPAPALVIEPGMISNPQFINWLLHEHGTEAIGQALAYGISECFPGGGLVGLSLGHAYRGEQGQTLEKGANALKGYDEDPEHDQEAEIAALYLDAARERLIGPYHLAKG